MIQLYKLFCINRGMGIENMGAYKNTTEKKESLNNNLGSLNNETEFKDINKQKKNLETQVFSETQELLNKEALIAYAKTNVYELCGIDNNMEKNSSFENFSKGFIDELIIGNYDMAIEVINTGGKIILDALAQLATWEGLKQMAESLGESVWLLFSGNAYNKGKSIALLMGGIINVGKKGIQIGMKDIMNLNANKLSLVNAGEVREIISDTSGKLDEIIPKKQFDFESMTIEGIAKIKTRSERLEAARYYLGGKELNITQADAIMKAHEIGKDRPGASIYNYSFREKANKLKILEAAGFTKTERKLLLEKGVCGSSKEFDGVDTLEMRGNYAFNNIPGLKTLDVSKRMEDFADSIDINHLVDNPVRIDNMLDIIEDMGYYINDNIAAIQQLNNTSLVDFKASFTLLRKRVGKLLHDDRLEQSYKADIKEVYEDSIANTFYTLHPNLAPKKSNNETI